VPFHLIIIMDHYHIQSDQPIAYAEGSDDGTDTDLLETSSDNLSDDSSNTDISELDNDDDNSLQIGIDDILADMGDIDEILADVDMNESFADMDMDEIFADMNAEILDLLESIIEGLGIEIPGNRGGKYLRDQFTDLRF
jgi:hypothetical protein